MLLGSDDASGRSGAAAAGETDRSIARTAGILRDIRAALSADAAEAADPPSARLFARAKALAAQLPAQPGWLDRMAARILRRIDDAATEAVSDAFGGHSPAPALRGPTEPDVASYVLDSIRIDVSVATQPDGSWLVLVQLDAERTGDRCAALDAVSGALLAESAIDAHGGARLRLERGTVHRTSIDVAARVGGETLVARGIDLR